MRVESKVSRANSGWTETNGSNPSTLDPRLSTMSYSQPSTMNYSELSTLDSQHSTALIVTLSYMCVLFILSSIPGGRENGPLVSAKLANIAHVPAYGLLALLWIFTLRNHGVTEHRSMCVAFLVALGYGALTELHQVWVPGRFPSAFDVMFNVAGSLTFIWLYWWVKLHRSFSLVERLFRTKRP